MEKLFYFCCLLLFIRVNLVVSLRSTMVDICNTLNPTVYCTCDPSEYEITTLDCILLRNVTADDHIWKVFEVNTDVVSLRLSARPDGQLKYFPSTFLNSGKAVKQIFVRHGDIRRIPTSAFHNSTSIISIDLAGNMIKSIDHRAFAHLPSMNELTLSDNELTTLKRNTFYDVPKLSLLFLDRNKLESIENGAFANLGGLSELDLNTNSFRELKHGWFKGLSGLARLYLGSNKIQRIAGNTFQECPNLQELNLRQNMISSIHENAFKGLSKLVALYLARNQLVRLHPKTFKPVANLAYFDLQHNQLETLTNDTVAPFNLTNNVTRIYLNGNKFVCDCKIKWMYEMFLLRKGDYMSEWKDVGCLPPVPSQDDAWTLSDLGAQDDPMTFSGSDSHLKKHHSIGHEANGKHNHHKDTETIDGYFDEDDKLSTSLRPNSEEGDSLIHTISIDKAEMYLNDGTACLSSFGDSLSDDATFGDHSTTKSLPKEEDLSIEMQTPSIGLSKDEDLSIETTSPPGKIVAEKRPPFRDPSNSSSSAKSTVSIISCLLMTLLSIWNQRC